MCQKVSQRRREYFSSLRQNDQINDFSYANDFINLTAQEEKVYKFHEDFLPPKGEKGWIITSHPGPESMSHHS